MNTGEQFYYLLVNLGCLIVPFIFSFHPRLLFYKRWTAFLPGVSGMMLVFIPWDIFFTGNGIWGFDEKYTTGVFMLNLPLEEWLFFLCIPYACLFTYHCIALFTPKEPLPRFFRIISWALAVLCMLVAVVYYQRWYTFTAHLLCGLLLLYHLVVLKSNYLGRFMLTFLIILPPFILSNGILTGIRFWDYPFINTEAGAIAEKIVWYNNQHNLGVRLFSMPVDDLSYGMAMLLLVTTVYEWQVRNIKKAKTGI